MTGVSWLGSFRRHLLPAAGGEKIQAKTPQSCDEKFSFLDDENAKNQGFCDEIEKAKSLFVRLFVL